MKLHIKSPRGQRFSPYISGRTLLFFHKMRLTNSKIEKIVIKAALEKTNGKKNEAAILLGLGRNTLAKKIKELEI